VSQGVIVVWLARNHKTRTVFVIRYKQRPGFTKLASQNLQTSRQTEIEAIFKVDLDPPSTLPDSVVNSNVLDSFKPIRSDT
jgi:hypothetical protein